MEDELGYTFKKYPYEKLMLNFMIHLPELLAPTGAKVVYSSYSIDPVSCAVKLDFNVDQLYEYLVQSNPQAPEIPATLEVARLERFRPD